MSNIEGCCLIDVQLKRYYRLGGSMTTEGDEELEEELILR
jgi:hypothetical protein